MAADTPDADATVIDERGVTLTAEGRQHARQHARQQLAEAEGRRTPAERDRMRQEFLARLDAA